MRRPLLLLLLTLAPSSAWAQDAVDPTVPAPRGEPALREAALREAAPSEGAPNEELAPPSAEAPPPDGWLALGPVRVAPLAEVWARGEVRVDPPTAAGTGRDLYLITTRIRVGLDARWEAVRLFLQAQDARNFGAAPPGAGAPTTLHQGFLEVGSDGSYVRLGRQEIDYGGQRMLGALDWLAVARSFDGIRGHVVLDESLELDAFAALVRAPWDFEVDVGLGPQSVHSDGDYLGALSAIWRPHPAITVDLYALYRHDDPLPAAPTRRRNVISPGLRLTGAPVEGLRYELEAVVQAGERGVDDEHLAFGLAGEVSYAAASPVRPTFALGASYGSGASPDGSVDELDNFFPTNHKFYGFADYFGWRNLLHGYARASLAHAPSTLSIALWLHTFGLAEPTARWSDAGGATLGQDPAGGDASLGQEIDVTVAFRPLPMLSLGAGYALFIPNGGAARLGLPDVSQWAFVQLGVSLGP